MKLMIRFLPSLQVLFLNENELKSIEYKEDTFQKLEFLRLENNAISTGSSLDALNHFPCLTKLRCKGNPFFSGNIIIIIILLD